MSASQRKARLKLSPPQNIYFSKIQSAVGNDPLVHVEPLRQQADGSYLITIRVRGNRKARALATLLVLNKQFGNILLHVQVRNLKGNLIGPIRKSLSAREITELYRMAFKSNRLFDFAVVRVLPFPAVFPVFKAKVVQFFADNLADLYSNLNFVAASVFGEVLKLTIGQTIINFSTEQKK